MLVAQWPSACVRKLLPQQLRLAPGSSVTGAWAPVVFIFGRQSEGANIFGGVTLRTRTSYCEFALGLPGVFHERYGGPFTYFPSMVCSHLPAVWLGNAHYGFAKRLGSMAWTRSLFSVTDNRGSLVFDAVVEPQGAWDEAADVEVFRDVKAHMTTNPILGRKSNGTWVLSHFDWDSSDATARSVRATPCAYPPLSPALDPYDDGRPAPVGVEVSQMIWRLGWPTPLRL